MGGLPVCLLCALALLTDSCHGYVLRRRADSDNRLAEALDVIARERRRLKAEEDDSRDYLWQDAYAPQDTFLRELFGEIDAEGEAMPELEEGPEAIELEPASTEEYVDDSELQNIFDEEERPTNDERRQDKEEEEKEEKDAEKKRTIPWQLGGPKPMDKPDKKSEEEDEDDLPELTSSEVLQLLNDADEVAKESILDDTTEEPVSEEEIKEVLDDVPEEDEEDQEVPLVEEDEDTPDTEVEDEEELGEVIPDVGDSKAWLLSQYMHEPYAERTVKRKRSEDSGRITEEEDDAIVDTMEECLRRFIELEDEENTKLAQALNLATLGQVARTDQYIPAEVDFLKGAVKDEEEIKQLRRCLQLGVRARDDVTKRASLPREDEEDEMEEEEVPVISREMEEIPAQTQEADINDMLTERLRQYLMHGDAEVSNQIADEEMMPVEDDKDWLLNPFYRELYEKYSNKAAAKRSGMEGTFGPIEDEEEDFAEDEAAAEADEEALEGALETYISQLSPMEQQELNAEVEEALQELPEEDVCPAIEEFTDNCAYALSLDLELDEEAMDLCNRHQLCYSCGAASGLSYRDCDKGFLAEADERCDSDEECKDEAAGLFVLMVRNHQYQPEQEGMCQDQCVLDYIVGPEGSNL